MAPAQAALVPCFVFELLVAYVDLLRRVAALVHSNGVCHRAEHVVGLIVAFRAARRSVPGVLNIKFHHLLLFERVYARHNVGPSDPAHVRRDASDHFLHTV